MEQIYRSPSPRSIGSDALIIDEDWKADIQSSEVKSPRPYITRSVNSTGPVNDDWKHNHRGTPHTPLSMPPLIPISDVEEECEEVQDLDSESDILTGCVLHGESSYEVHEELGHGVYGKVFGCQDLSTGTPRAVKVLRLDGPWATTAKAEATFMQRISNNFMTGNNIVRLYETLHLQRELCLVMEVLDCSLLDFLRRRQGNPLRVDAIAYILRQIFFALETLEILGIVHGDIKGDNIMLADHRARPFHVKLIDFSNAMTTRSAALAPYGQSRWYRAPEVALGRGLGGASDVWSLGCVAAELATARPLFPARTERDLLRAVCSLLGPPPARLLLAAGSHAAELFAVDAHGRWHLKEPVNGHGPFLKQYRNLSHICLYHMSLLPIEDSEYYAVEISMFADFLEQMLTVDERRRITVIQALRNPFLDIHKVESS